tara:strand:+ start:2344 stop:2676 length:333 start_codon:yes stop_codon:yes gene_type:complete
MNNLRNRVQLIGNLGSNPTLNETGNGVKYSKISVATNSSYINKKGEKIKETQWHPVMIWGKQAEFVEKYIVKGQEVCIEGKLNYRSYEDSEGNSKYICEIIASEILLLKK